MSNNNERLGALWKVQGKKDMMSGNITVDGKQVKVVGFINREKYSENSPDINLYVAREQEQEQRRTQSQSRTQESPRRSQSEEDLDIPF